MSESDPLARFRPGASRPATATARPAPGALQEYKAFGTKDKLRGVKILTRHGQPSHAPMYNYLINLSFTDDDPDNCTAILITISGLLVTVTGTHLKPIVDALLLHSCEFIQEYDPARFARPADPGAPFVDSITVDVLRAAPAQQRKHEDA
jgi:hypothetical protein